MKIVFLLLQLSMFLDDFVESWTCYRDPTTEIQQFWVRLIDPRMVKSFLTIAPIGKLETRFFF